MLRRVWLLLAVLVLSPPVMAADIRATSGEWRPIEIIVEPFGDDGFADIIAADLNRSGDFRATIRDASSFGQTGDEDFAAVRALGGEYLLVGQVRPTENKDKAKGKELKVFFQLADAITGEMLEDAPLIILFDPGNRRLAAHSIGNWIVKKIARKVGVFHTKVAYVLRRSDGMNELKIADYDGHSAQTILTSQTRLISPAWTPDGNALLYVSFEHRKPVIYWQSLLDGSRRVIANFKGSNSAPAMSPNGRTIAAALTLHGGDQQIYLLEENRRRRVRESGGINTEPDFSPNGRKLLLTSDEGGSPQIYEMALQTGKARRLTFGTNYAVNARYSTDGALMVYVRRGEDRQNNIALMDIASGTEAWLTDVGGADSPSFSANDTMILFADENRPNRLYIVSVNGRVLTGANITERGAIADPAWGPLSSDWF